MKEKRRASMFACDNVYPADPEALYPLVKQQAEALVAGVPYPVANLANVSALLNQALADINWVGFYLGRGTS
jgi:GAF domain-containing protein